MYEAQPLVDLQENSGAGDPNSWLSSSSSAVAAADDESNPSSPTHCHTLSQLASTINSVSAGGNFDRILYNSLVDMFPLVETLIDQDRKANSCYTRRGSMIYTKTPSREFPHRKMINPKGRDATQSILIKKKRSHGDKDQGKYASNSEDGDSFSVLSSRAFSTEKEMEELAMLREQVEDLQKKLSEKDQLLKSAEISKTQMETVHAKFNELKMQAGEKDSLVKSIQQQLHDAKIKLADKQAALEKIHWEAMTSNKKAEKLQEELDSVQGGISSFMLLLEGLIKNDSKACVENCDFKPSYLDYLPDIDDLDDMEILKMEEARKNYAAAVAAAKEKQDEESIAAAASARVHLQSFAFRSNHVNTANVSSNSGVS